MARGWASANSTAAAAPVVRPVLFAELVFASGTVRMHSAVGTITWGSADWLGAGSLGRVDPVEEGADIAARGLRLQLSGIPAEHIAIALGEHYQGQPARLYVGFLDAGHQLVADPELVFAGRMDTMDVELGESATIQITAESRLAAWERPNIRRYTHEDQVAEYPDDRGLEFVAQTAERELIWGRA